MVTARSALIVGVDAYPTRPLRVCVHDAREMAAVLAMPEYSFTASVLLDEEVTRKNLKKRLDSFFRASAEVYVFYFSGHGWATDVGTYLVTVDADADEEGVDLDYVRRLITTVVPQSSTVLLILDCCHAGAATARDFSPVGVEIRTEDVARAIPTLPRGRVVLAACRGDQSAYEDHTIGHGLFTFYLLEGLMGEAADASGSVTVARLYDHASHAFDGSHRQTPVLRGDLTGRLVLGHGFIPRTSPETEEAQAIEIEREAQQHLKDYQSRVASEIVDLEQWRASGYKQACQALEPMPVLVRSAGARAQLRFQPSCIFEVPGSNISEIISPLRLEPEMVTTKGTVKERLGSGTFGSVWLVQTTGSAAWVALKVYHPQDLSAPDKIQRFRRGYEAMKQLDHPYVVKVHEFSECPLGFYMDFVEGPNLRSFTGTLDNPKALISVLFTVAETLRHAHGRGVVHRDVKPENIIMSFDADSQRWHPFLSDFDLAWFSTATKLTKEALGTMRRFPGTAWEADLGECPRPDHRCLLLRTALLFRHYWKRSCAVRGG